MCLVEICKKNGAEGESGKVGVDLKSLEPSAEDPELPS